MPPSKWSVERQGASKNLFDAIQTVLAFAIDRGVSQNTSMSRWDATRLTIKGAFSKQALAVVWDFAEANPFSGGTSDWDGAIEWVCKFIETNLNLGRLDPFAKVQPPTSTFLRLCSALVTDRLILLQYRMQTYQISFTFG